MGLFKPNIEKMKLKGDIKGLIKTLSNNDPRVCEKAIDAVVTVQGGDERRLALIGALKHQNLYVRNKAARALLEYKNNFPVEQLVLAIPNTPDAIEVLIEIGDHESLVPIVREMSKMDYHNKRENFLRYVTMYGEDNQMVIGIGQGLNFPDQFAKKEIVSCGEKVGSVVRKLSASINRISALSEQQIVLEYKYLKQKGEFLPTGLQNGLAAEVKKKVKEQLTADKKWLSDGSSWKKTSFRILSAGWEVLILTDYIRGDIINSYYMILWRSSQNNKEVYYYSISGERNW